MPARSIFTLVLLVCALVFLTAAVDSGAAASAASGAATDKITSTWMQIAGRFGVPTAVAVFSGFVVWRLLAWALKTIERTRKEFLSALDKRDGALIEELRGLRNCSTCRMDVLDPADQRKVKRYMEQVEVEKKKELTS